jgi:hypothetical protein
MTSAFATIANASRTAARAGVRAHVLAVIAKLMQAGVVLPPRSPGPGRP